MKKVKGVKNTTYSYLLEEVSGKVVHAEGMGESGLLLRIEDHNEDIVWDFQTNRAASIRVGDTLRGFYKPDEHSHRKYRELRAYELLLDGTESLDEVLFRDKVIGYDWLEDVS